jgi:hypothetical protein
LLWCGANFLWPHGEMEIVVQIPIASASAAEKQIDQLQIITNAIILAAILIILADAAAGNDVSFLGLKTTISGAYNLAALAFILATLTIAQLFARLANMVEQADADEVPRLLATLFNHRWSFNPYSYFGPRPLALLHAIFGIGLLAFVWWMQLLALCQLWNRWLGPGVLEWGLWYADIGAGCLVFAAMGSVYWSTDQRLNSKSMAAMPARRKLRAICALF